MNQRKNHKPFIILATSNSGKVREISNGLKGVPYEIKSVADYPEIGPLPQEKGETYEDNALLKARFVWALKGGFVLADDSGLECEDLAGRPGKASARFAGEKATDDENNRKLLEEIQAIHDPSRRARYVAVLILIDPDGQSTVITETCNGLITFTPGGSGGFGYDPYFYLPQKKCTMAELSLEDKNKISHRGKAVARIKEILTSVYAN